VRGNLIDARTEPQKCKLPLPTESVEEPKIKTGGRTLTPSGDLRLISHLSEPIRERIYKTISIQSFSNPKRDRPFPIEIPVACGEGCPLTRTRWTRLRDRWLCP
jgi:hypothetical protein